MSLPILSLKSKGFAKDYTQSFHRIGFGGVRDHGIPYELIAEAERVTHRFFELPSDTKELYTADPVTEVGYVASSGSSRGKAKDLKEFFVVKPNKHSMPVTTIGFDFSAVIELVKAQEALGAQVIERIEPLVSARCPAFKGVAEQLVGSGTSAMRMNYFPSYDPKDNPDAVPAAGHRDLGFLTVLSPATESGLWFTDRNCPDAMAPENHQLVQPFRPGKDEHFFVTNIGEVCSLFTGGTYDFFTGQVMPDGYLAATWHGVDKVERSKPKAARVSLPLFMHLRGSTPLTRFSKEELAAVEADPRINAEDGAFFKHRAIILETVQAVREHDGWLLAGMLIYNRLARHGYGRKMELD